MARGGGGVNQTLMWGMSWFWQVKAKTSTTARAARFHFSPSSCQQHPPGQVLFRFHPLARVSYYVNILSLFLPARCFLLVRVSSVPCQQIIKKRESSSINIAPVFLFFFFFSSPRFPPSGCESTAAVLNHCCLLSTYQHVCLFSSSLVGLFVWTSHHF